MIHTEAKKQMRHYVHFLFWKMIPNRFITNPVLLAEGRLPVIPLGGAGCGACGLGLINRVLGAFGLRPTGTTTRVRGARWTAPWRIKRRTKPGGSQARPGVKRTAVERREAHLPDRKGRWHASQSVPGWFRRRPGASQAPRFSALHDPSYPGRIAPRQRGRLPCSKPAVCASNVECAKARQSRAYTTVRQTAPWPAATGVRTAENGYATDSGMNRECRSNASETCLSQLDLSACRSSLRIQRVSRDQPRSETRLDLIRPGFPRTKPVGQSDAPPA
jgi:hypothetical protein